MPGRLVEGKTSTQPRVVIEHVSPEIDTGRFPIKRTVGDEVTVTADVFADGHDKLAAVLRYRATSRDPEQDAREEWREIRMRELGNDRWTASFAVTSLGQYKYSVQAWVDHFASWCHEISKKHAAGVGLASELREGAAIVRAAATRAGAPAPRTRGSGHDGVVAVGVEPERGSRDWLSEQAARLESSEPEAARVAVALAPELATAMAEHASREGAVTYEWVLSVTVERELARCGAWYEMFPRSAGPDPSRSATFDEAAGRLPDIAAMGFDVVYLPPIHPIGRAFRKGRNNTLVAGPGDPGSPWAIGAETGGHKAVEPGLGTIEDFERFVATARRLGLEIALDIAYQCSPDHPYVREHPEWFRHRPDGTIKYAENPPKKYEDIYPFDFDTKAWRALWMELKSVIDFWIARGVKVFRVDNPHTKPFRFWEWMIGEVRREHPDAIFLSEAFTRPRVMEHLAKLGFSQSYTYFTWRNTKPEIESYFTELTQTPVREYLRPNLFANTPDILHAYLQTGGRAAFQVRLILAATLGATYGIYSGLELCENRARPGTEEYLDSEKYQIRQWDWERPGRITELVARVNQIRRENPALQRDWTLQFHSTDNPEIVAYSKATPDASNVIFVVVNLDPHRLQHGWVQAPIWRAGAGLDGPAPYDVHDLVTDERFTWRGEWNYVRLDPGVRPAHIFRLSVPSGR